MTGEKYVISLSVGRYTHQELMHVKHMHAHSPIQTNAHTHTHTHTHTRVSLSYPLHFPCSLNQSIFISLSASFLSYDCLHHASHPPSASLSPSLPPFHLIDL